MVHRPHAQPAATGVTLAAWDSIQSTQQRRYEGGWLTSQPDHASLAADIAARLQPPWFPALDETILRGIGLHDQGWAEFDDRALSGPAPPRSFIQEEPATFVEAWTSSIDRSAQAGPIAGMIVSKHFSRLAAFRAAHVTDAPDDRRRIERFSSAEELRQRQLSSSCGGYDAEALTDVLQFCDLLSLYLCCGAGDDVEFPQEFQGARIRLQRVHSRDDAAICRFSPRIFGPGTELGVSARRWPQSTDSRPFLSVLE